MSSNNGTYPKTLNGTFSIAPPDAVDWRRCQACWTLDCVWRSSTADRKEGQSPGMIPGPPSKPAGVTTKYLVLAAIIAAVLTGIFVGVMVYALESNRRAQNQTPKEIDRFWDNVLKRSDAQQKNAGKLGP